MHARTWSSLAVLVAAPALALGGASGTGLSQAETASSGTSPIRHVVIIYEENHTFDSVLGRLCQTRDSPCDGYTGRVRFADGVVAPNIRQPDIVPNVAHAILQQRQAMASRWDRTWGCTRPPYPCISHIRPADSPNVSALARRFAVSDRTFAAFPTASYGAHLQLTAGRANGFTHGANPVPSTTGATPLAGWGCPSHKDVLWGSPASYVPSCVPDRAGLGPYRPSPVPYVPTIMQRTEQAGLSWHIYQGSSPSTPINGVWSVCTYFQWCYRNRFQLGHDSGVRDLVRAARTGTGLPNLSLVIPTMSVSQHNLTSMKRGDSFIGWIVGALERGPQWRSTAVFITYDDCGCFYDHVAPPSGRSFRNPMIIISPWAKRGFTDSATAVQPYSMLTFVQHTFGLHSLSPEVDSAYDYSHSFDFGQTPLSGVPMVRSHLPAKEKERLARLTPLIEEREGFVEDE